MENVLGKPPPPPPPQQEEEHAGGKTTAEPRRRRRRWGEALPSTTGNGTTVTSATIPSTASTATTNDAATQQPTLTAAAAAVPSNNNNDNNNTVDAAKAKVLALQESIRARLAAAKAKVGATASTTNSLKRPASELSSSSSSVVLATTNASATTATTGQYDGSNQNKRAKVYQLDLTDIPAPKQTASAASGATAVTSTEKAKTPKPQKKWTNPYLAHHNVDTTNDDAEHGNEGVMEEKDVDAVDPSLAGGRAGAGKIRQRHKAIRFVEPGKYQQLAATKRALAAQAAAAGFVSGRKIGHTLQSTTIASIYGGNARFKDDNEVDGTLELPLRCDAHPDTTMPLTLEWWDVAALLPSKLKKQVAAAESNQLTKQTKAALQQHFLSQSKTTATTSTAATTTTTKVENESEPGKEAAAPATTDAATAKMDTDGDDPMQSVAEGIETKDSETKNEQDNFLAEVERLRQKCYQQASLSHCKTAELVQHIVPIQPPSMSVHKKQPVLPLTKKELKRQRKLRRQEKQRELQDLQAAGLIPAPEPRLTLQNFIRVLGDQAWLDPSQMEAKVKGQMQARLNAHLERNRANKLTTEQRAAKLTRKYQHEDTAGGAVHVALFYVKNMSHPYHRTKVDVNAQQNAITGGVISCPSMACIIAEGGPKAMKRYKRLLLVRMKWTGPDSDGMGGDDDEDDAANNAATNNNEMMTTDGDDPEHAMGPSAQQQHKFDPHNCCRLVWEGMTVKRHFTGFVFQATDTSDQARKVFKAKGLVHYWDQVYQFGTNFQKNNHGSGGGDFGLQLRLAYDSSDDDNDDNDNGNDPAGEAVTADPAANKKESQDVSMSQAKN